MQELELRIFDKYLFASRWGGEHQYFESLHDNNGQEILIQIDFSEKFSFIEQSTTQSAHWTNNQVTYNQLTLLTAHLWFDKKSISNVCIWLLRS